MGLFQKIREVFKPKNESVPVAPIAYPDEEFLNVVMEQTRRRTQVEQADRAATSPSAESASPLP